jgi:hypothetical protein
MKDNNILLHQSHLLFPDSSIEHHYSRLTPKINRLSREHMVSFEGPGEGEGGLFRFQIDGEVLLRSVRSAEVPCFPVPLAPPDQTLAIVLMVNATSLWFLSRERTIGPVTVFGDIVEGLWNYPAKGTFGTGDFIFFDPVRFRSQSRNKLSGTPCRSVDGHENF